MLKRNPNCQLCPLHKTAEYVCLLGTGGHKAMIIGEAPGKREDDSGRAFVGQAGQLLDRLLKEVGLDREDFFVTNAVHCRPPENRTPTKGEIKACRTWVEHEIDHVKPKFILLLGNTPLSSVLDMKGIRDKRGKPIEKDGVFYLPTYHPAYILRDPGQEAIFKADLMTFRNLIESGGLPKEENLNLRIVETDDDFIDMITDIEESSLVSYDIETNGLYPFAKDAAITLFGVGTKTTQWSLPLDHPGSPNYGQYEWQKKVLQEIVNAAKGAKMCAHNAKFDSLWLKVIYDIEWRADFDTMLAHYILDENSRHGLKELATVFCNAPNYDVDKDSKQGITGPIKTLARYHAHDLYYTRKLALIFGKELKRDLSLHKVFYKLIMPVARMFIDIEYEGVFVDVNKLESVGVELRKRMADAEEKMDKYSPGMNWGSPKQVGDLLFNKLGLDPLDKTPKGTNSTSESVLKRLATLHEVPREMLKYREVKQQLSFFIDGWQPWIVSKRLHPSFKIHGTVTGRPSCADPNLQQVPRDPVIRSLLCAPDGWELVDSDLSQIELRIAAELAQEKNMLQAFKTGEDVHWKTVMREIGKKGSYKEEVLFTGRSLWSVQKKGEYYSKEAKPPTYAECIEAMLKAGPDACIKIDGRWKELRKKAKAINFGFLYGMWWRKFVIYALDNYGVVVSDKEAEESRDAFFELYPGFHDWHQKQRRFVKAYGYIRTLTGRMRRLPAAYGEKDAYNASPEAKEAQRQAINTPVQSFASDINLMAALELHETFDRSYYRIVGTVHDSILQLVRKDKLEEVVPHIKKVMSWPKLMTEFGIQLSVPIEAEVTIGPWGAGVSEKEYFTKSKDMVK